VSSPKGESDEHDAIPQVLAGDSSSATGKTHADVWYELRRMSKELKEGARTFAEMRSRQEKFADEIASLRLEAVRSEAKIAGGVVTAEAKTKLEMSAEIGRVRDDMKKVTDEISPRATPLRIAAWIAAFITVVGSPLASAIYFGANTPTRGEVRELDARLRGIEARLAEVQARLASRP
jgi:regulator of replication initiation timing